MTEATTGPGREQASEEPVSAARRVAQEVVGRKGDEEILEI